MEWFEFGDKYIDGQAVAKQMGVELPDADVPYRADGKIDKDWLSFVETSHGEDSSLVLPALFAGFLASCSEFRQQPIQRKLSWRTSVRIKF